ncbi:MAG: hypothetical protein GY950_29505 [bacterium]|nr:hypothetical protein [bacterium]
MRENTLLKTGIISCSFFLIFFFSAIQLYSSDSRSYEIQFFTVKLHGKIDYSRLRSAGVTKVIYRVFHDRRTNGGLYFNNTQFRTLEPLLEQLIAEFDSPDSRRLDLCAWMIGRKFKWIKNTLLFDYQYENSIRQMVPKLDIFNPDAIKKIIAVFKDLASKRIDSILIQDDFTLRFNEGFSSWGKARFNGVTKVPAKEKLMMAKGSPYNQSWKRVKIDQLNKVLTLIVKNCKMVNSGIKVGMNVYYEAPLRVKDAEAWYAHNLRELTGTGLDYIYLMSYHRQIKNEMKLSEEKNRELFKRIVDRAYGICKEKLIVKLQVRDWKTGRRIPVSEVKAYLNLVPKGVKRVCFTPVTVNDYAYLEELISGTQ